MAEEVRFLAEHDDPLFRVALRSDGILNFFASKGMILTFAVSQELLRAALTVTDRPRPTLVLMKDIARVDREARAFFASDDYLQIASQSALVVGSPVSRIIGNFFLGLNRPKYPVRIFTDPDLAVAWLKEYLP